MAVARVVIAVVLKAIGRRESRQLNATPKLRDDKDRFCSVDCKMHKTSLKFPLRLHHNIHKRLELLTCEVYVDVKRAKGLT